MNAPVENSIKRYARMLSDIRRHMHRHPEVSGKEYETTKYLAYELAKYSIPCRLGPDSRGLIVDLGNPDADKRLAIRADIDAIPVQDHKQVAYRSTVADVMHACGHDAHSSILLGTVLTLHEVLSDKLKKGAVRAIFQPEEEVAKGATAMINFGALEGVTAIVAGHVDPTRDIGKIGFRAGINTAHCNEISVAIRGRGGHAARPHETIDPVEIGSRFILECYAAVPRYTEQAKQVVVSFTSFHGGDSYNVISDEVRLSGTMRSLDQQSREDAICAIKNVAAKIAQETGATIKANFGVVVPSLVTNPELTAFAKGVAAEIFGEDKIEDIREPSMGGEDFAFYSQCVPASFARIGSRGPDVGNLPLHNSSFDIDEQSLVVGVNLFTNLALQYLSLEATNSNLPA